MKRPPKSSAISGFRFLAIVLLAAWVIPPALAQQDQSYSGGVVDDWTHQHVIFSNPGTLEDALKKGKYGEWQFVMNDPRYQMQQVRRYGSLTGQMIAEQRIAGQRTADVVSLPGLPRRRPPTVWNERNRRAPLHPDWSVQLGGGAGATALDVFPAKYTFSPIGAASCTNDFVVFATGVAGNSTQAANLFGFNNVYPGTCTTGTVPTTLFAYFVGTGKDQTSPALSLDGTKVAFVESVTNGSIFHVLTMDKSGNSGCPNANPCNGTAFNSPAVPGVHNSAVDIKITLSGGESDSISPPFVDYSGDIAYVGDDTGKLHKITGVFTGTPAEAGSPWPVTVSSGVTLTGPVFDGGASQNIFVSGSDSNVYCITKAGAHCSTPSVKVGTGPIIDPPVVDSVSETVFAAANSATNAVLLQATTSLGTPVRTNIGANGTDYYSGTFDNVYYTAGPATGHMYWCGNTSSAATPELYQISFNSSGLIQTATPVFQLVQTGSTGTSVDCSPLTEFFNSTSNIDYLFLSVKEDGFSTGTPNCANNTCLMSFALPQTSPFTFPSSAHATMPGGSLGPLGTSGQIIDNASSAAGASQIYFGNLQNNDATQVSQSGLQ